MPRGRHNKIADSLKQQKPQGTTEQFNRQIGKNLIAVIKKHYPDIPQMLAQFNLSDYTLEQYASGDMEIPAHLLWRIALHLNIPIETFFMEPPKDDSSFFIATDDEIIKNSAVKIFYDASDKSIKH